MEDGAPGCFGSPLIRGLNPETCDGCLWRENCAVAAQSNHAAMLAELSESVFMKPKPTVDRESESAPKRLSALATHANRQKLTAEGLSAMLDLPMADALAKIRAVNPNYLRVTLLMLRLAGDGHFTRKDLVSRFEKNLGWTQETSTSHASMVVSYLSSLSLITFSDGVIKRNKL